MPARRRGCWSRTTSRSRNSSRPDYESLRLATSGAGQERTRRGRRSTCAAASGASWRGQPDYPSALLGAYVILCSATPVAEEELGCTKPTIIRAQDRGKQSQRENSGSKQVEGPSDRLGSAFLPLCIVTPPRQCVPPIYQRTCCATSARCCFDDCFVQHGSVVVPILAPVPAGPCQARPCGRPFAAVLSLQCCASRPSTPSSPAWRCVVQ